MSLEDVCLYCDHRSYCSFKSTDSSSSLVYCKYRNAKWPDIPLVDYYKRGVPIRKLKELFHVNTRRLYAILRSNQVELRRGRRRKASFDDLRARLKAIGIDVDSHSLRKAYGKAGRPVKNLIDELLDRVTSSQ